MMTTQTVTFVTAALDGVGVPLPARAVQAREALNALHEAASRDVVAEALAAAQATPLTAKAAAKAVHQLATALVTRTSAGEAARALERPLLEQFRAAVVEETEALIVAMRPAFDEAAQTVHAAAPLIAPGITPTVHDGPDAVAAYHELDSAVARLNQVQSARFRVSELGGYVEPDVSWFIAPVENQDRLGLARAHFRRGWHALVSAGFTLRFNTPAEATAVVAAAAAGDEAAQAAADRARRTAARDPLRDAAYAAVLGE